MVKQTSGSRHYAGALMGGFAPWRGSRDLMRTGHVEDDPRLSASVARTRHTVIRDCDDERRRSIATGRVQIAV